MFLQAAELSLTEIKSYRNFVFTATIGNPTHDPFFSVENAPSWMTSLGYQLYVLQDDSVESTASWNPEDASSKDLKAYRNLGPDPDPVVESQPLFLREPAHQFPFMDLRWMPSHLPPVPVPRFPLMNLMSPPVRRVQCLLMELMPRIWGTIQPKPSQMLIGQQIKITRQLKVDNLLYVTRVPPTFNVPRTPTALLLDLSASSHLLKKPDGGCMMVDSFIRAENQDSWDGSGAHTKGDAWVHNFTSNPNERIRCRRHALTCNGIDKCQFLDPELFAGLERFEADENAMRELWNHELDQNEAEAASPSGIIARAQNVQFNVTGCLSPD
ncbi:hypothetical protein K438DRAFT_2171820 [Mycena galopus ATCC 62051]|nr:hypothetical protein K438DRAFT_2171820 [Mycena galopus ATCC 62051]